MDEFLWAFGSMLFVMLIVYFLPLSFTKNGKMILVFTSFLVALGGLAADASFSFLLTVLILFVLILFVTYLMDQRLGKWLYVQEDSLSELKDEEFLMDSDMETAASHESGFQSKNEATLEPINLLKFSQEKNQQTETKQDSENDFPAVETGDEDISFLLNRSVSMEKEMTNRIDDSKHEVDYLSEIEELLFEDSGESVEPAKSAPTPTILADDENEIPVISFEDQPLKKNNESCTKAVQQVDGLDEIPILPFLEKEGKQS